MKKRFMLLLVAIMLLFSACGPEPSTETKEPVPSNGQPESSGPAVGFKPSATIEETVLVDESDVKITATGIK